MKKLKLLLPLLPFILTSCGYNSLQAMEEAVFASWADIQSAYQRRADLIPNLVETVKGSASHEREVFTEVTEARARAGGITISSEMINDPDAMRNFQQIQGQLSSALSRLLAVAENYPDLKANQNFLALQSQLEGTENRISVARNRYNDKVRLFNSKIRQFPFSLTNNVLLNLERKEYFEAEASAQTAPEVSF